MSLTSQISPNMLDAQVRFSKQANDKFTMATMPKQSRKVKMAPRSFSQQRERNPFINIFAVSCWCQLKKTDWLACLGYRKTLTWGQALFSFRLENNIPAGKAKRKESLIQTFYETSSAHFFDWLTFAELANQNYFCANPEKIWTAIWIFWIFMAHIKAYFPIIRS